MKQINNKTESYVKATLSGEGSGHDWWHVNRVWQNALHIARTEVVDMNVVSLAALLHDIADWKFHDGDETAGSRTARHWLESQHADNEIIAHVCTIIDDLSFKGAGVHTAMKSTEGMVVQDADRLDALGAIGIARTFAYGGHNGREIFNPDIPPELHTTFEHYKKSTGPTINHFYEKLLLLKDRMNTATGRSLAGQRHAFMLQYLEEFKKEWSPQKD